MNNKLSVGLVILLCVACNSQSKELDWDSYTTWISDNSSLLSKEKNINDMVITVIHQPNDYLAYREMTQLEKGIDSKLLDSLKSGYGCGLSFKIKLETNKPGLSLLYYKIQNQEEYKARINHLSFGGSNFVSLRVGDKKITPKLINYELYNELSNTIVFSTVFVADELGCNADKSEIQDFTVTFDDPYWDTGMSHFKFTGRKIAGIPALKI